MLKDDKSFSSALGSAAKMKMTGAATRLAGNFDPLNLARLLTFKSPMLTAAAGKLMGRSKNDISYFTGGRYGNNMLDDDNQKDESGSDKRDGIHRTKFGPGKTTPIRVGDGTADLLAKLYNLTRSKIEYDLKMQKINKSFSKEQQEEHKRFMEKLFSELDDDEKDEKKKEKKEDSLIGKLLKGLSFVFAPRQLLASLGRVFMNSITKAIGILGTRLLTLLPGLIRKALFGGTALALAAPGELGDGTFDKEKTEYDKKMNPMTEEQSKRTSEINERIADLKAKLKDKNTLEAEKENIGSEITKLNREKNKIRDERIKAYRKENPFKPKMEGFNFEMSSKTGSTNEMADLIRKKFKEAGFSDVQAEAAVVNAFRESSLNPKAGKDDAQESSFGLFGANRRGGLGVGRTPEELKDPNVNIDLAIAEAKKSKAFSEAKTTEEAIDAFVRGVERPSNMESEIKKRIDLLTNKDYMRVSKPVDVTPLTAQEKATKMMQPEIDYTELKRKERLLRNKELENSSKAVREMNKMKVNERLFKSESENLDLSKQSKNITIVAPQTNMTSMSGQGNMASSPINRGVAMNTRDTDDTISWLRKRQGVFAIT
jgi:hypothetical protein